MEGRRKGFASGAPCVLFASVHAAKAGTSEATKGVAPSRAWVAACLALVNVQVTVSPARDVDVRHRAAVVAGGARLVPAARDASRRASSRCPARRW